MYAYYLKRMPQGDYVTPAGSEKSYTKDIRKARQFFSMEEASRERCTGNEVITTFDAERMV